MLGVGVGEDRARVWVGVGGRLHTISRMLEDLPTGRPGQEANTAHREPICERLQNHCSVRAQ